MSELFASGDGWVGAGVRSTESGLEDIFTNARRRIVSSVYSLSGGAFDLPPTWISDATDRGVEVVLVVNRLLEQHPAGTSAILSIARRTELFVLFDYNGPAGSDLHAKVAVRDEASALIGSSNYSARGLLHNYELAVMVTGDAARRAAHLVVSLTSTKFATRVR